MSKCPKGQRGAFQAMGTSLERPRCMTKIDDWLGEAGVWVMPTKPAQAQGDRGCWGLSPPPAVLEASVVLGGLEAPQFPTS